LFVDQAVSPNGVFYRLFLLDELKLNAIGTLEEHHAAVAGD
jgi:hypothetical protein